MSQFNNILGPEETPDEKVIQKPSLSLNDSGGEFEHKNVDGS